MSVPKTLIGELADRRCIVFVGSGVSRQCLGKDGTTRPPGWAAFLEELMTLCDAPEQARAKSLMGKGRLLDAAEIILAKKNASDFSLKLRQLLETPQFAPSTVHTALVKLCPKIMITTNYDTLLEEAFSTRGASPVRVCRYYEDHAVDVVRSDQQLVLKAHGCVTNPRLVVLSRSDYFDAKSKYANFYELLNALFLVHTVLFIGCSLDDPDIQLVLETAHIKSNSAHPHYAIMAQGTDPELAEVIKKSYNIQFLTYENNSGTHAEFSEMITGMADEVVTKRGV